MRYQFFNGEMVRAEGRSAKVIGMVPGNGRPGEEWYFVQFEDGLEDRFQAHDMERE